MLGKSALASRYLDGLGSTEMLHIFLSNRSADIRYSTTGTPVSGYELAVLDESGEPVATGEMGELWVQGVSTAVGYWNQRAKSLHTFQGRWTRTGDKYIVDADGYYPYCGRTDDMLKVGGQWVSPFEVESALLEHAAIVEAAVVGHLDDDGLVKPCAFVVLANGEQSATTLGENIKIFVKDRLAPFKYPRWVHFTDILPKTATGENSALQTPPRARRFTTEQSGFVAVPGGKVWYQMLGAGPKTPLLTAHGYTLRLQSY